MAMDVTQIPPHNHPITQILVNGGNTTYLHIHSNSNSTAITTAKAAATTTTTKITIETM